MTQTIEHPTQGPNEVGQQYVFGFYSFPFFFGFLNFISFFLWWCFDFWGGNCSEEVTQRIYAKIIREHICIYILCNAGGYDGFFQIMVTNY
jgi:hypothetical protein